MAKKPKKRRVTGGVDIHKDTRHAAVALMNGRRLADREFPATTAGHADLLEWLNSFGRLHAVGVKCTGSYGAALTRHLAGNDVKVIEVNPCLTDVRLAGCYLRRASTGSMRAARQAG